MSAEDFDRHFREKLAAHRSQVDTEKLWTGVESGLSGRRKPFAYRWITGLFILLAVLGGGLYMGLSPNAEGPETERTAQKPEKPEMNNDKESVPPSGKFASPEKRIHGERLHNAESAYKKSGPAFSKEHNSDSDISNGGRSHNKQRIDNFLAVEADQTFSGKEEEISNPDQRLEHPPLNADEDAGNFTASMVRNPEIESTKTNEIETDSDSPLQRDTEDFAQNKIENKGHPDPPDFLRREMMPMPMRPIDQLSALHPGFEMGDALEKHSSQVMPSNERRSFFMQFDAGGGFMKREIVSRHDDFNELARQRTNTEKPLEFLNAQLTFGMRFNNGMFWRSGLNIARVNEHFSLNRTRTITEESELLSSVHVNAGGDSVYTYTTETHTTVMKEDISHYNSYTLIDIPLYIGYDHDFGMWTLGAELGAMLNLSMEARGTMMSPANDVIRIEDSGMFRDRVNWSATANLRIGCRISERLTLRVSPGVRILPGSILSVSVMDQHYTLFGGTFGVEYNF